MYGKLQSNCLLSLNKKKNTTINNVSHKKGWRTGALKTHVDPPPTQQVKINSNRKAGNSVLKINSVKILRHKSRVCRN